MHTSIKHQIYKTGNQNPQICCGRMGEMYLNAMLEAVEFPAGISDLNTGLTNVDRNALSHFR